MNQRQGVTPHHLSLIQTAPLMLFPVNTLSLPSFLLGFIQTVPLLLFPVGNIFLLTFLFGLIQPMLPVLLAVTPNPPGPISRQLPGPFLQHGARSSRRRRSTGVSSESSPSIIASILSSSRIKFVCGNRFQNPMAQAPPQ